MGSFDIHRHDPIAEITVSKRRGDNKNNAKRKKTGMTRDGWNHPKSGSQLWRKWSKVWNHQPVIVQPKMLVVIWFHISVALLVFLQTLLLASGHLQTFKHLSHCHTAEPKSTCPMDGNTMKYSSKQFPTYFWMFQHVPSRSSFQRPYLPTSDNFDDKGPVVSCNWVLFCWKLWAGALAKHFVTGHVVETSTRK